MRSEGGVGGRCRLGRVGWWGGRGVVRAEREPELRLGGTDAHLRGLKPALALLPALGARVLQQHGRQLPQREREAAFERGLGQEGREARLARSGGQLVLCSAARVGIAGVKARAEQLQQLLRIHDCDRSCCCYYGWLRRWLLKSGIDQIILNDLTLML